MTIATAGIADDSGGLVQELLSSSTVLATGTAKALTRATLGGHALPFVSNRQGVAAITGAPDAASIDPLLAANPDIAAAFSSPTASCFAMAELGGTHTATTGDTQTATSSVDMTIDLTKLASHDDLIVALANPLLVGSVGRVDFTVTVDGVTIVDQSLSTSVAIVSYFTDHALDLGNIDALDQGGDSILRIGVSLTVASTVANAGFFGNILVGDPPAASPAPSSSPPSSPSTAQALLAAMAIAPPPTGPIETTAAIAPPDQPFAHLAPPA